MSSAIARLCRVLPFVFFATAVCVGRAAHAQTPATIGSESRTASVAAVSLSSAASATATPTPAAILNYSVARLAADPVRSRVYATVPSDNSVIVIDTTSLSVIATIPIGSFPQGLAPSLDRQKLWVANSGSTNFAIGVIDLNTLGALPSLPAPIQPYDVEEGLGHRLYVTCFPYSYPDGGIMQIDANSGAFQAYLHADFGDTYGPGFLEISSDRRTLFFGGAGGSEIDEFNVAAGQSSFVQKETFGGNGEGLNVSHDSHLIVYPNGAGDGVPGYSTYEIPTANIATVNGIFDVGAYPTAASFSNDDTLLYHGTWDQNAVKIFDTKRFTLVGSIALDPNPNDMVGYFPVDVVVDRSGRWLFVATGYPEPGGLRVYDTGRSDPLPPPRLGNISTRGEVGTSDNVLIGGFVIAGNQPKKVILRAIGPTLDRYGVPGALINPTLELHNGSGAIIATNDDWQTTQIGGVITSSQASEIQSSGFAPGNAAESAILATLPPGNYTAIVRGKSNTTGIALVECYDLDPTTDSTLGNISTRGMVQGGDNVLIAGTIVASNLPTNVLIRALGPTLTRYGVPNALADPTLGLYDANGALVTSNDNWPDTQQTAIQATNLAPPDNRESAILATLPPGNHTAIVRGKNGAMGVALVEVYRLNN